MGPDAVTVAGRRFLVLGMGVTGRAAAQALRQEGAEVTTVDLREPADHQEVAEIDLSAHDVAIASPGWPPNGEGLRAVAAAGIEIWSEIELAWRIRREGVPWVLVTGTNGKTTTVQMVGAIADAAGLACAVVGNVGDPVVEAAREPLDLMVVEISSFQLHYTFSLAPLAAVCLNIDDDHLDWHGDHAAYRAAKARVYSGVTSACVYPTESPEVEDMVRDADVADGCRAIGLTLGIPSVSQLGVVDGHLVDRAFVGQRRREAVEIASLSDLQHLVAGQVPPYLALNALAAGALARAAGVAPEHVAGGLRSFALDAHRSALVDRRGGVAFVDDSKATNPHAARAAFGGVPPGTGVWIAGGLAKGASFDALVADVAARLRAVVLIGLDPEPLAGALARHAPGIPVTVIEPGETVMERAVDAARAYARPGDTVLLAPACASMDQFRNYAERGNSFARAVKGTD